MIGAPMSSWVGGAMSYTGCMAANMNQFNASSGLYANASRILDGEFLDYTGKVVLTTSEIVCPRNVIQQVRERSGVEWEKKKPNF